MTAMVETALAGEGTASPTATVEPRVETGVISLAYLHDGTLEGLLTAIFDTYANHEAPSDVAAEGTVQLRIGQEVHLIQTDFKKAERVVKGLERVGGKELFEVVKIASLSDDPGTGAKMLRFIRYCMAAKKRFPQRDILHPDVEPVMSLYRQVRNEEEYMRQFLRFSHLENGLWFARCDAKASVVPLLMTWFSARFNTQPFIIWDEKHRLAGAYDGSGWQLVRTDTMPEDWRPAAGPEDQAPEEQLMQAAWKGFYDAIAIDPRYNPELRRQNMPVRFWKNLPEMKERTSGLRSVR